MKQTPPRWAERFLEWYCRPEVLEEIHGDIQELFERAATEKPRTARWLFAWNVLRFFRLRNIKKFNSLSSTLISTAMIKNMILVSIRNFLRQPTHSFISVFGLTVGFVCAMLIMLWTAHQYSYDRFHTNIDRIYKVITHVSAEGNIQTYDVAAVDMDVASVPEVTGMVTVITGKRWPNELCFRPEGKPNECVYFNGVFANGALFDTFSFEIIEGDRHPFTQDTHIAISQKMAEALYGNESPLGKTIKIDGWQEVTVVSVFKDLPGNSSLQFQFVMPFFVVKKLWGIKDEQFNQNFFQTYILTHDAVSADELNRKLNDISVLTEKHKAELLRYEAIPFGDWYLHSEYENGKNSGGKIRYVRLFTIIGALVLMMAVINFVNLSTARASLRCKEIGVRKVHGAARASIALQFITESFLVTVISFILALVVTHLLVPAFNNITHEELSLQIFDPQIVPILIAFLFVVAFVAGLYPAMVFSSFQPVKILKGLFATASTGSLQLRKILTTFQLGIGTAIIIFTGVLYLQINYISNKALGFDKENTIRVEPTWTLLKSYEAFKADLLKNPSIAAVGASNANPLDAGGSNTGVSWNGKPDGARISFTTIGSMYDFPETIGLKILQGRGFIPERGGVDSLDTDVLVTAEAVRTMGMKNPIGEKIKIGDRRCQIVGVVNDFHTASLRKTREPVIIYQTGIRQVASLYVKYKPGQVSEAMSALQHSYKAIENSFNLRYWFQDDTFDALYKTEKTASSLVMVFTVVGLIIAVIGIVGLATFNVMRRKKELSIRRVLGATGSQSVLLLFAEFSMIVAVAVLIAVPTGWYASTEWLSTFSYHIETPWWLFVFGPIGITAMTLVIISVQAFKTIRTNPTEVLRTE